MKGDFQGIDFYEIKIVERHHVEIIWAELIQFDHEVWKLRVEIYLRPWVKYDNYWPDFHESTHTRLAG